MLIRAKNKKSEVIEEMPKSLADLKDAKRNVKKAGGQKIDFKPILAKIMAGSMFYTKREVWESPNMVGKKVSLFRTKKLLDNAVTGRRITRLYQDGKFYYGVEKPAPTTTPPTAQPPAK